MLELIKYMPTVLDFDNKRSYFKKELKKLKRQVASPEFSLKVRRRDVFHDAFNQFSGLNKTDLMGSMKVTFHGEPGADWGGLLRDFFIEISKAILDRRNVLFVPSDNGSTYMPDARSYIQGVDHLRFFKFVGRIIGKALLEGCLLEAYFVRSIYKMLIG